LYQPPLSAMARERLDTLRQTSDGFAIAEKDLQLRGPGELLGTRQTGVAAFRMADLARDFPPSVDYRIVYDPTQQDQPAMADRIVARWVGSAARYAAA